MICLRCPLCLIFAFFTMRFNLDFLFVSTDRFLRHIGVIFTIFYAVYLHKHGLSEVSFPRFVTNAWNMFSVCICLSLIRFMTNIQEHPLTVCASLTSFQYPHCNEFLTLMSMPFGVLAGSDGHYELVLLPACHNTRVTEKMSQHAVSTSFGGQTLLCISTRKSL